MIATVANMRLAYDRHGNNVKVYDPSEGEYFSANPGDYFYLPDDYTFTDEAGEPCILVVPHNGHYELNDDGSIIP